MLPEISTIVPGPHSLELAMRLQKVECRNTTFCNPDWPIFWERADGVNVWDVDGNRYLDLTSAFGVASLGHSATATALREQAHHLTHAMGDVHPARIKVELCEKLSAMTFERWTGEAGKCLLGNSGFEAVEAALKTARLATRRSGIIAFEGGYHGLGYGALLGAGIPWFREPFEAQLAAITTLITYPRDGDDGSVTKFRESLASVDPSNIAALLVEPFQGRGGIVVPHATFLTELRQWCDSHGVMLILDEIYTGFHRTGKLFGCDWSGVAPDLICLGKALSGGFPISACVGNLRVMDAWPTTQGEALHTSTFLGNPLGCAMAIAALEEHSSNEIQNRVRQASDDLEAALAPLNNSSWVHQIRGPGLMKGIELRHPGGAPAGELAIQLVIALLKEGFILLPDAPEGHVLAITPPLNMSREEMDASIQAIHRFLESAAL